MIRFALLLAVAFLTSSASLLMAQESSVRPGINRAYENPQFDQWVRTFERPGREIYDRRQSIVNATGLKPGMVVADIGAGTGLFTLLFAPRVEPEGRVIAVDISQVFIDNIMRRARAVGADNVQGVLGTATDASLPPASIDLAFVCDTYHHFEYPQKMLASLHRALRPGGSMIVIDFRRIPGFSSPWVMQHVRAGKSTVVREVETAGFQMLGEESFLLGNYFLRFKKP